MSEESRREFLSTYCSSCVQPVDNDRCGSNFRAVLSPISLPSSLKSTHAICEFCLDIHHNSIDHQKNCIFAKNELRLYAGGWATTISTALLSQLRKSKFKFRKPFVNSVSQLVSQMGVLDAILVPVPMGDGSTQGIWGKIVSDSVVGLKNIQVIPALLRHKKLSTRQSSLVRRRRIASEEYEVNPECVDQITGRSVILLDDNVTTGSTIVSCAQILSGYAPRTILPVVFERYVSPRIIKLGDAFITEINCDCFEAKTKKIGC